MSGSDRKRIVICSGCVGGISARETYEQLAAVYARIVVHAGHEVIVTPLFEEALGEARQHHSFSLAFICNAMWDKAVDARRQLPLSVKIVLFSGAPGDLPSHPDIHVVHKGDVAKDGGTDLVVEALTTGNISIPRAVFN